MAYEAKLDWKYADTPTENDANRWEQGILDNNLSIINLTTRLQAVEDALFSNIAHNKFEEDFSNLNDLVVTKGWFNETYQRIEGPNGMILDGFGGAYE
ncbi:hypothetical protein [Brevibacillus porteri]|uniref:hypothetical protein n=1 Tax=Brevibacillus porteri TaxID=2126350 RepID=UPI003D1ACC29